MKRICEYALECKETLCLHQQVHEGNSYCSSIECPPMYGKMAECFGEDDIRFHAIVEKLRGMTHVSHL